MGSTPTTSAAALDPASPTHAGQGARAFARVLPAIGWVLLLVLLVAPLISGSRYFVYLGTLIVLQAALATSLNLVIGYAGQFALAHAAFFGFGAYASALLVAGTPLGFWGAVPVTVAMAGGLAALIGYPALRYTGGVHFALLTFAVGELARLVAANWHGVTGGPMGMRVLYAPEALLGFSFSSARGMYLLAVAVFVISVAAIFLVQRSRFGRGLVAIREDETLAAFLGVNVLRHKVIAFVGSAALAALAGTVYAPFMSIVTPDMLSAHEVISWIGMLIVGGIGTIAGPIIGAVIFFGLPELFRVARLFRLVLLGVVIVLVVLFMPKGIAGVIKDWMRRTLAVRPVGRT